MTTIQVKRDEEPQSPREWDNLGVMACWHRRYNLGDEQPKETAEEWLAANAPQGSVMLPLYLYDHSGITMNTTGFSCLWDSGQVGWIVATPEAIRKTFGVKRITKKVRERAEDALRAEVSTYDDFLTGNVWGFVLETNGVVDSVWGFFGSDDSALEAMKEHVPAEHHKALEQAWENR